MEERLKTVLTLLALTMLRLVLYLIILVLMVPLLLMAALILKDDRFYTKVESIYKDFFEFEND